MDIKTVLKQHEEKLLQFPNVTGVGIGEQLGMQVIIVFVTRKVPESKLRPQEIIPKTLNGFETDVRTQISVG